MAMFNSYVSIPEGKSNHHHNQVKKKKGRTEGRLTDTSTHLILNELWRIEGIIPR